MKFSIKFFCFIEKGLGVNILANNNGTGNIVENSIMAIIIIRVENTLLPLEKIIAIIIITVKHH